MEEKVVAAIQDDYPDEFVGRVKEIHPKKWKVETEVFAGNALCARGEVVAVLMPPTFLGK
jgi:hypothetical protein